MQHEGRCHCGNLQVRIWLTQAPDVMPIRSCACTFCRRHGTRTVSDPVGHAEIEARDWSLVQRYRFGSGTADFVLCRTCGVYIGAVCETASGLRSVINTLCLDDRDAFTHEAVHPDYDGETTEQRLLRRAANWMPTAMHGSLAA
jgi:hypothetical protein